MEYISSDEKKLSENEVTLDGKKLQIISNHFKFPRLF